MLCAGACDASAFTFRVLELLQRLQVASLGVSLLVLAGVSTASQLCSAFLCLPQHQPLPQSPALRTNSHSSSGVGADADSEACDGAGGGARDGEGSGEAAAGADEAEVGDAVAASHEDTRVDDEQLAPLNAESETHGVRIDTCEFNG